MENSKVNPEKTQKSLSTKSLNSAKLTASQSLQVGICSGAASSLINHPFQVLRARFQNNIAIKSSGSTQIPPPIFPSDHKILFRGFSATFLSMCCLTVTQSMSKHLFNNKENNNEYTKLVAPIFGGFFSAVLTTPLEGAVLRQSKTVLDKNNNNKDSVFKSSALFFKQYGLQRLYLGGFLIGIRTSIVGSGFSLWVPWSSNLLENKGMSPSVSTLISGMLIGTAFAAISQPPESLRIEQQFSADEKKPVNIRQACRQLTATHGLKGLFKGGAYRIPRTAPGIFINAAVYQGLESYFTKANNKAGPEKRENHAFKK